MIKIQGKYCKDAKIFTDNVEDTALSMVYSNCDDIAFKDAKIRLMPDCHAGKDCCVGFSVPVGRFVNPNHIGVDIGCRMTSIELSRPLDEKDYPSFEHQVKETIPLGFNINTEKVFNDNEFYEFLNKEYKNALTNWSDMIMDIGTINENYIGNLCQRIGMDISVLYKSIGSLGGGNHFQEYGVTDDNRAFFTIHCGSRNFGVKVCRYWSSVSKNDSVKSEMKLEIERIKKTVTDKTQWGRIIDEAKFKIKSNNPFGFLSGDSLKGYLSDMVVCTAYAKFNHEIIIRKIKEILTNFGISEIDRIESVHNYIDFNDHILRKGAIRSYVGEKMIIPFNMRDGIAVCEGKSNDEWNCTAPHGAGRIMSRSDAKKTFLMDEFEKSMEGIYSTSVCEGTIDESPMVYKPMEEILKNIEPTAKVLFFIRPKINIKSS